MDLFTRWENSILLIHLSYQVGRIVARSVVEKVKVKFFYTR